MWFNKTPAKPTVAPTPTYILKPPPIKPGRHTGEYAVLLNTIEHFYGKGMENYQVECVLAILKGDCKCALEKMVERDNQ